MVQPTALNFVVVTLMVIIGMFIMRTAATALLNRNSDSKIGAAIGALIG